MPGHSRSKNGVAPLAYVPGIHALLDQKKAWMAGPSPAEAYLAHRFDQGYGPRRRDEPGHDGV